MISLKLINQIQFASEKKKGKVSWFFIGLKFNADYIHQIYFDEKQLPQVGSKQNVSSLAHAQSIVIFCGCLHFYRIIFVVVGHSDRDRVDSFRSVSSLAIGCFITFKKYLI